MIYVPLRYTAAAKYPKLWLVDQIILVDMLLPIVATSSNANELILHAACVPPFVLSFMCVYEIGYFENDTRAAACEASPSLTPTTERFKHYRLEPLAWVWALMLAGVGIGSEQLADGIPKGVVEDQIVAWAAILAATRIVFYLYNRLKVAERPPCYFLLQVLKYCGILTIFRPTSIGALVSSSQVIAMSMVYWVYRTGGKQKTINREFLRLIIFIGIGIPFALSGARMNEIPKFPLFAVGTWLLLRLTKPVIMSSLRTENR